MVMVIMRMKIFTVHLLWLVLAMVVFLRSVSSDKGRLVGGQAAPNNLATLIVSIQFNGVHYCAGSIINANWVLTAAHCLESNSQVLSSKLVAGTNNIENLAKTAQTVGVSSYIVNELYTGGPTPYDIGLIRTSQLFKWTTATQPIALPALKFKPTGSATIFGWGSTSTTKTASWPDQLQMATIPIISLSACENALGSKGVDVHETNICTGPLTGGVSICSADSGGPLIQKNSLGKNMLVGIVSWGKTPCGQKNSPSVYVNVGSFVDWISENI